MKKIVCCLIIGLSCLLLSSGLALSEPQKQKQKQKPDQVADPNPTKIDDLLKKWDRSDAPGCVVAVVKDGQIVYQHSAGAANVEFSLPLTLSTLFLIASLSKQFTAFAIMLLVSRGSLNLDDDVRKHIPELPKYEKTITVDHLIHHTSGLREYTALLQYAGWRGDDVVTEKDFLQLVSRQKELNFEPGSEFSYCNTGYHLLGLIVKRVSGKSLNAFAQEEMFKPLAMKNTLFREDYRLVVKNGAESYAPGKKGIFSRVFIPHGIAGATNMYTNAPDLVQWDANFYKPKVGSQKVIDMMYTKGKLNSGKEIPYAGGLVISKYRGLTRVGHSGSHGGFRTILIRFPEQRFSVIALANTADFSVNIVDKIVDLYLQDKLEPVKKEDQAKEVKLDTKALDRFAGQYLISSTVTVIVGRDGDKLFAEGPFGKRPLMAVSETEFLDKETGNRFTFTPSDKGMQLKVRIGDEELLGAIAQKIDLTAAQMKEFAGDFYSQELDVIYHVFVKNGKLMVGLSKSESVLRPVEHDKFSCDVAGASAVDFQRAANKSVSGFTIGRPGCRNLRFIRIDLHPGQK